MSLLPRAEPASVPKKNAEPRGVGASVRRKEDDRLMRGRGRFIGDMRFAGQLEAAFVRSTLAHGRIRAIHIPPHLVGRAFTNPAMARVQHSPPHTPPPESTRNPAPAALHSC